MFPQKIKCRYFSYTGYTSNFYFQPNIIFCKLKNIFSWQFPHFYGLAESRNVEYAYAGYKMLGQTNPKSAMAWSAANILALALIMAWAHHLYLCQEENRAECPINGEDSGGMPMYCSYKYMGGLFLGIMAWYQYKWWLGSVAAAYTIFGYSTALITFVGMVLKCNHRFFRNIISLI